MNKILISGLLVSLGLFMGRISGFIREAFIASSFGATEHTDLIILFLSTPDVLVNLLVGGAFGMALIPEFSALTPINAKRLYQQTVCFVLCIFTVISVLLALSSEHVISLLAPGLEASLSNNVKYIFSFTFFAIPITAATGVTTAYLHYKGTFFVASLGTLIFNVIIISGLCLAYIFNLQNILFVICVSIILATSIRWLTQSLSARVYPLSFDILKDLLVTKALLRRYLYCVLTSGIIFLLPVVSRALASKDGVGVLSLVNYSIKLVEFPLGVVITVFSIVFFPKLASDYSKKSSADFECTLSRVLLVVICISIAVLVPLYQYSILVTSIVYDWGKLSNNELLMINSYFLIILISLPFQGVNAILVSALAARKDTLTPLLLSTISVIIFVVYSYGYTDNSSDVLYAMNLVYFVITFGLVSILIYKHKLSFFNELSFMKDFIKVIVIGALYALLLSSEFVELTQVWQFMLFAPLMVLCFIVLCFTCNKSLYSLFKK